MASTINQLLPKHISPLFIMSTFSSVVRKPGQKIVPKAAPRRNINRQNARPSAGPSLTPESHAPSPGLESTGHASENEETAVSTYQNDALQSASITLSNPTPPATALRSTPDGISDTGPSVTVEVYPPKLYGQGITIVPSQANVDRDEQDVIPTITASTIHSTRSKPRPTNEPTPALSEASTPEIDATEDSGSPDGPRKRQKTAQEDRGASSQPRETSTLSENLTSILRSSPRLRRSESRTSDALLQDATSQAAAVSELANSIANSARSIRSIPHVTNAIDAEEDAEEEQDGLDTSVRSRRRKSRKRAIEDLARGVIEDDISRGRRNSRKSTPENGENMQTDPNTSMSALARDPPRVGKKSETEKLLQENWAEIRQRRKEDIERRREAAGKGRHGGRQELVTTTVTEALPVPQQIIVNGQIVVAAESREIAFGADVERAVIEDASAARDDDRIYRYVNQGTVGKHAGLRRGTKWDDEKTELFYKGLRWFGTDFGMIANFFPQLDRRQVKLKYLIELRADGPRVKRSVDAKEPVNMEEYASMTEHDLVDPVALQAELDAEEKRLRDEDEQRRRDEGLIDSHEPDLADVALPSTEIGDGEVMPRGDGHELGPRDRLSAIADQVLPNAASKKRQQQQQQARRQTKESVGRGRQSKKGRRPVEGVEEQIGPVGEVGR